MDMVVVSVWDASTVPTAVARRQRRATKCRKPGAKCPGRSVAGAVALPELYLEWPSTAGRVVGFS
jgi:hypothetical protein